jgi:predicted phage terminase large subunit-like protein
MSVSPAAIQEVIQQAGLLQSLDKEEAGKRMARNHILNFAARLNSQYTPAAHLWLIADALERVERGELLRVLITMPPRHGKSELASVNFPAWFLGRNPDKRIIAASYSAGLSFRFSRRARNLLREPRWPFDGVTTAGDWSAVGAWDIANHRGGYIAASVAGAVAGHGANILMIDDPVASAEEARSVAYRERTWEWFLQDAVTRLEPQGAIILIGTRWHEDDLIGRVLLNSEDKWHHLNLPAISEDGEALWPERYPIEVLEERRAELGAQNFEALYQQRPSSPEGEMFKRFWWRRYMAPPTLSKIEQFVDSSFKTGVKNDYSVIATWGYDGQGSVFLLDLYREKLEYPDLMMTIHREHAKWAPHAKSVPVVIEDKASGQSAIQTLRRPLPTRDGFMLPALPVVVWPVASGSSKESRAEGVSPFVEAGRVFIPVMPPALPGEPLHWTEEFIDEHAKFPNGAHDDMVDTTVMALDRLIAGKRRGGGVGSYLPNPDDRPTRGRGGGVR